MQRNNLRLLPRTVTYGCCKFEIFALNMTAFPAIPLPPSSLTHHMFSTPTHHHPHTTTHTPPPTHQNPASHWRPTDADTAISQSRTTWRETTEHMTPYYIQFTIQHTRCMFLPQIYHRCYMYGVYNMSLYNCMMFLWTLLCSQYFVILHNMTYWKLVPCSGPIPDQFGNETTQMVMRQK